MTKTRQVKENAYSFFKKNGKYREIHEKFTSRLPYLYEIGNKDERHKNFANHIDYFQYHYVSFLIGKAKTLHRTFEEVDGIKSHDFFNKELFYELLEEIKFYLHENEMYESLELYKRSMNKIIKRAGFHLKK